MMTEVPQAQTQIRSRLSLFILLSLFLWLVVGPFLALLFWGEAAFKLLLFWLAAPALILGREVYGEGLLPCPVGMWGWVIHLVFWTLTSLAIWLFARLFLPKRIGAPTSESNATSC
ncbi:MAG: hypothetical protein HN919_07045 [Verrucomicrobia bacterium]|jgi:hypothetical protein|nr:hypothetical protein [Verrucomicrobiota bacterium]